MSKETGTVKSEGAKIETQSKFVRMVRDGVIQSVPRKEVEHYKKIGFKEAQFYSGSDKPV